MNTTHCPACGQPVPYSEADLINRLHQVRGLNGTLLKRQDEALGIFAVIRQYLIDAPPQDDEQTDSLRRMIPDHIISMIDDWTRNAVKTP